MELDEVAGDGEAIVCENNGLRWEPA